MAFRKKGNKHDLWKAYCLNHQDLIDKLALPPWPFLNEKNFRDFASRGVLDAEGLESFGFDDLKDAEFWELFDFINAYFEMDAILFDAFNSSRIERG